MCLRDINILLTGVDGFRELYWKKDWGYQNPRLCMEQCIIRNFTYLVFIYIKTRWATLLPSYFTRSLTRVQQKLPIVVIFLCFNYLC